MVKGKVDFRNLLSLINKNETSGFDCFKNFLILQSWFDSQLRRISLSLAMVVRVWNALEKEKMMARLRKINKEKELVKCPTLEALPSGWNRINLRKLNGIRAKYYIAPSGMRY